MEIFKTKEMMIVIIDDNLSNQNQFAIALNYIGLSYHCLFIKTMDIAMKKLRRIAPDFIIINVETLTDIKCFERIKKIKSLQSVKLVSYGSNMKTEDSQKILKGKVDYNIAEISDTSKLMENLKTLFSKT